MERAISHRTAPKLQGNSRIQNHHIFVRHTYQTVLTMFIFIFLSGRVWNVSEIKFNETISFKTTDDHSKFGVGDTDSDWICVGDINRAVRTLFQLM